MKVARSIFLTEFDLIDRYRLDHPGREMWDVVRLFILWPDPVLSGQSANQKS